MYLKPGHCWVTFLDAHTPCTSKLRSLSHFDNMFLIYFSYAIGQFHIFRHYHLFFRFHNQGFSQVNCQPWGNGGWSGHEEQLLGQPGNVMNDFQQPWRSLCMKAWIQSLQSFNNKSSFVEASGAMFSWMSLNVEDSFSCLFSSFQFLPQDGDKAKN